jgi:hypothetical protein
MLSQPDNAIDLDEVMDQGKILLVNLSRLGSHVRGIVGSLLLSLLRRATLRRSQSRVAGLRETQLYCDDAQHFETDVLFNLIAEARKFNVGLTIGHQYMHQFDYDTRRALSSVGSTIIFAIDGGDAEFFAKDLLGKVTAEDLVVQPPYHAFARIGEHITRIFTNAPPQIKVSGQRDQILERSRRMYCKPVAEVVGSIRRRAELSQLVPKSRPSGDRNSRTPPRRDAGHS